MTQVIMLFLFPIGFYFYFVVERKEKPKYQEIFDNFGKKIRDNNALTNESKIEYFRDMLLKNGYHIKNINSKEVIGEKRILSMSLLTMSLGVFYVGIIFYLIYYLYFQKPHRVEYKL